MLKLLVVCSLLVAAIAQAPIRPKLDNSFSANVDLVDNFQGRMSSIHGKWFVNALGRVEAFESHTIHLGKTWFYHFYNTSKLYEYRPKHDTCHQFPDARPFYGAFDWIQYAKLNGKCKKYGTSTIGHKWEFHVKNKKGANRLTLDLCASDDSQSPYWLRVKDHEKDFHREVIFKAYTPGMPKPQVFRLPAICNSTETVIVDHERESFEAETEADLSLFLAEMEEEGVEVEDPSTEGYHGLEHLQMKFDLKCSLCQAVISGVRETINNDSSQAAVQNALKKVCKNLKFASEICSTLLAPLVGQIARDLANQATDRKICDDVHACN